MTEAGCPERVLLQVSHALTYIPAHSPMTTFVVSYNGNHDWFRLIIAYFSVFITRISHEVDTRHDNILRA